MRNHHRIAGRLIAAVATLTSFAPLARAQNRTQVTISDSAVMAENLTSSRDGTVYFGSMAKGTIYRAPPGTAPR